MSLLNLGIMWRAMSEAGIWFPSCGIHGLCGRLAGAVRSAGGEIRTSRAVGEVLVRSGRAAGVRTAAGETFEASWVVSNADYKKTFLELLPAGAVPAAHREPAQTTPYTGSELCVYLGIDPKGVDFGAMRAEHLFYRSEIRDEDPADPADFANR